jgi:FAD-dependent urate hydroxylase
MEQVHTRLLIIGAGPFGLSLAAYADHLGIENRVHGSPMAFWRDHMPTGMYLRSGCDWHLDATGVHTFLAYLDTLGLRPADVEPLSLPCYLSYVDWFIERRGLRTDPRLVHALDRTPTGYRALLDDRSVVTADNVVLALGFRHFANVPDDLVALLPSGRYQHTCDLADLEPLADHRCLVVGGRQSAYEWAALLHEAGAASVDVCHRHASPSMSPSDWTWVAPLVDDTIRDPGWYRRLSPAGQEAVGRRMWAEGRLKVEPWLRARLDDESVRIRPHRTVAACEEQPGGALRVVLDDGTALEVDDIVLATGYKADVSRVPLLVAGNVLGRLETRNGMPVLDERFQTNLPGLFITSMLAVQSFGPFFAFTISVRASATLIGQALVAQRQPLAGRH